MDLVLTRTVATVAAIAALLGSVDLARAQSDGERLEMLRGGAQKKGVYNIFGLDGSGVGRDGFQWKGTHKITAKKEKPDWTAPAEMIARQKDVPRYMKGGDPDNPLGTHAMYLGSTLYRIHGSPDADSVGEAESSGCFRTRNVDVADLYNRVPVGTTVVVK